jgi:hypothetical protein
MEAGCSMLNSDLIIGVIGLIIAGIAYSVTRDLSFLGGVFVNYTLIIIVSLATLMIIKGLVKPERLRFFESTIERNNVVIGIGILAVYLFFMPRIGFLPASYLFFLALSLYLSEDILSKRNIVVTALISGGVVALFYFLFRHVLEVPLPQGSWFN